ncbi:CRISPR-associated protein Cst1 [Thermobifida halotolerans]
MIDSPASTPSLRLTGHPLQRCGAWALTALADRRRPEQLSAEDLEQAAQRITEDVAIAAAASKEDSSYDWWKVLFALYPGAKPTHHSRQRDRGVMRSQTAAILGPDPGEGQVHPCVFCGQECTVLWTKSTLPLFDTAKTINTLPPKTLGWPICHGCRLAMWALPYGAWLTAGSATVLTCEDPQVEWAFVTRNVKRANRIRQLGFNRLTDGVGPEAVALRALREHAVHNPVAATLWMFKNDNQEPWLKVVSTRIGTTRFLQRMLSDPACREGWQDLKRTLHRTDAAGRTVVDGTTALARLLFDPQLAPRDRLVAELFKRSTAVETVLRRKVETWRSLVAVYLEEMHAVDTEQLKPLARMVARWIATESSRGRFNEYRRVAGSAYPLHKLLMAVSARLYLDGGEPGDVTAAVVEDLLAAGANGWRLRALLWFEVLAELGRLGVSLSGHEEDPDEEEPTRFDDPLADVDERDEEYV